MTPVTIDPELLAKLTSNGGRVPLADGNGNTVGFFVSSERLALLEKALDAQLHGEPTLEEFRRSIAKGGRHTMEEVLKLVEE
jgi:hypothetical protein